MLDAYNTCVRLQSRVTSSGPTVNNWMILFYFSFVCFGLFSFVFVFFVFFVALQICAVVVMVLFSFCLFSIVSFLSKKDIFISILARRGHNHLLARKLIFLILELYISFEYGREVWL